MADLAKMDYVDICEELRSILRKTQSMEKISRDLQDMRKERRPYSDQIDYVYTLLQKHNLIPDPAILEEKKSDAKAEEFRRQGNALYILKTRNVDAIQEYNRSICYAVSQKNISIGLANRSAVFFEMKMYPECVESIRLAREVGVPERLKEKLDRRELMCKEKMKTLKPVTDEVFVPKIGLPVNEKIPFLAKCLSLREDSTFGRYVVTEEDIPAGTIIALEEPICKVVVDRDVYLRCANCLVEVPHLFLPCGCTQTMFCSKECEMKAFEDFHAIECPIIGSLMKLFLSDDSICLGIRLVIIAFFTFQGDIEKMEVALEKMDREKKNIFSFDWSQKLSPEDLYTTIYTLKIQENEAEDRLFTRYVASCLVLSLLQQHSPFKRFLTNPTAIKILKNLILHHILSIPVNGYPIDSVLDFTDPEFSTQYGCAFSHLSYITQTSCVPNVAKFSFNICNNGFITLKNIAAGEQLFCSSGSHHALSPKDIRQKELFEKFNVICKCVACTENYPIAGDMAYPADIEKFFFEKNAYVEHCTFDFYMKGLTKATDYIRKYGHLYPIFPLVVAEEELKMMFSSLCLKSTLRIKEKIRLGTTELNN